MSIPDLLLTLAEMGVTLAALSAVAGVIGPRRADGRPGLSIRLLRDVAILGMQAGFFAVLPLIFLGNGPAVWRWCSAAALVLWVALYATFLRDALGPVREGAYSLVEFGSGLAITLLGFGLLASNVFWPSGASTRRYVLALVCMLVLAGGAFVLGAFVRREPPAAGG